MQNKKKSQAEKNLSPSSQKSTPPAFRAGGYVSQGNPTCTATHTPNCFAGSGGILPHSSLRVFGAIVKVPKVSGSTPEQLGNTPYTFMEYMRGVSPAVIKP